MRSDLDAVAPQRWRIHKIDAGIVQRATHLAAQRLEKLSTHVVPVNLQHEEGATLQVGTEHQSPLRPDRPALDSLLGQEIRHRKTTYHEHGEQNGRGLHAREMQHWPSSLCHPTISRPVMQEHWLALFVLHGLA